MRKTVRLDKCLIVTAPMFSSSQLMRDIRWLSPTCLLHVHYPRATASIRWLQDVEALCLLERRERQREKVLGL
jgi:hypothetical protein